MANSTITPIKPDDGWSSMLTYCMYVIEGLVIGVSNFIIAIAVLRYSALRKAKEYLMVMGLSIADGVQMMALFAAGLYRITLVVSGKHSEFKTPWDCAIKIHNILWSFSQLASCLMLLVISIDRLLAVAFPLKYIGWTRKYAWAMLCAAYGYCLVSGTFMYYTVVYSTINVVVSSKIMISAKCLSSMPLKVDTTLSMWYRNYYMYGPSMFMFASIVVYGPVWLIHRKHYVQVSATDRNGSQSQEQKLGQQRRVTISLGLSCLCTLFLTMIPYTIVRLTISMIPDSVRLLFFALSSLNPLCNVFIYSLRHQEMKEGIKALFTGKQMPDSLTVWQTNRVAKKKQKRRSAPAEKAVEIN